MSSVFIIPIAFSFLFSFLCFITPANNKDWSFQPLGLLITGLPSFQAKLTNEAGDRRYAERLILTATICGIKKAHVLLAHALARRYTETDVS
jgi:hypothetical protein